MNFRNPWDFEGEQAEKVLDNSVLESENEILNSQAVDENESVLSSEATDNLLYGDKIDLKGPLIGIATEIKDKIAVDSLGVPIALQYVFNNEYEIQLKYQNGFITINQESSVVSKFPTILNSKKDVFLRDLMLNHELDKTKLNYKLNYRFILKQSISASTTSNKVKFHNGLVHEIYLGMDEFDEAGRNVYTLYFGKDINNDDESQIRTDNLARVIEHELEHTIQVVDDPKGEDAWYNPGSIEEVCNLFRVELGLENLQKMCYSYNMEELPLINFIFWGKYIDDFSARKELIDTCISYLRQDVTTFVKLIKARHKSDIFNYLIKFDFPLNLSISR
jgi:hypothetical protein